MFDLNDDARAGYRRVEVLTGVAPGDLVVLDPQAATRAQPQ